MHLIIEVDERKAFDSQHAGEWQNGCKKHKNAGELCRKSEKIEQMENCEEEEEKNGGTIKDNWVEIERRDNGFNDMHTK